MNLKLNRAVKVSFFVTGASLLVFAFVSAESVTAPIPKSRPWSQNINEEFNKTISDLGLKNSLSNIKDPRIKQAIINASKGKCEDTNAGANINVGHKKQCLPKGRPPKVPNGKDGKKCTVPNAKGGEIFGMCIQGCCVYLGSSDKTGMAKGGGFKSGSQGAGGSSGSASGLTDLKDSKGLLDSFMKLFKGFGGGGGDSSGDSYYDPYNYDFSADESLDYNPVSNSESSFEDFKGFDYKEEQTQSENNAQEDSASGVAVSQKTKRYDVQTIVYRPGQESESLINTNYNYKDTRYSFNQSSENTKTSKNNTEQKELILAQERRVLRTKNINDNKAQNSDAALTGFERSEKTVVDESSGGIWDLIIRFIRSIF